jgi:alpha-tubulin suppressor-like RCC1 family protein
MSGVSAIAIAPGNGHTCAIMIRGGIKCWGYNVYGQLGIGSTTNQYRPTDVAGATREEPASEEDREGGAQGEREENRQRAFAGCVLL